VETSNCVDTDELFNSLAAVLGIDPARFVLDQYEVTLPSTPHFALSALTLFTFC
jgi:hypothetical protein